MGRAGRSGRAAAFGDIPVSREVTTRRARRSSSRRSRAAGTAAILGDPATVGVGAIPAADQEAAQPFSHPAEEITET
jgi:hypothetical protein